MKVGDLMRVIHPYGFEEIIVSKEIDFAKYDNKTFCREDFICIWQQYEDCEIDFISNERNDKNAKTPNLYIRIKEQQNDI